jgi:hypothetical protein
LADKERDRDELGCGNILKRERFNLYPPKEEDPYDDYDSDREDEEEDPEKETTSEKEEAEGIEENLESEQKKVDRLAEVVENDDDEEKLYGESALNEKVEDIVGIKSVEYA